METPRQAFPHLLELPNHLTLLVGNSKKDSNSVMGFEIKRDLCTVYLGNISSATNSSEKYLTKIMLAVSKKAIARKQFKKRPPTIGEWIGNV